LSRASAAPDAREYSTRAYSPPPVVRTADSIANDRFTSMVDDARPTIDFVRPRSGANVTAIVERRFVIASPAYPSTNTDSPV